MNALLVMISQSARRAGIAMILLLLGSPLALAEQNVATDAPRIGLLYWVGGNQLSRANPDGSDFQVLISGLDEPDGLVTDPLNNLVYWTNMSFGGPGGSLQRARLDGATVESGEQFLVAPGSFEVGKEIELDKAGGKLYWADRDGRHFMRANIDGSEVESVLHSFTDSAGETIPLQNPVGVALDEVRRHVYVTDRFMGTIMRFGMDMPPGENHLNRSDVEVLVAPRSADDRPIDIDLDLEKGQMYWTDRGVHQVLRAGLDGSNVEVLIDSSKVAIKDPIGISLDLASRQMYWTDMSTHKVHRASVDGSDIQEIIGGSRLLNGLPYGPLGIQYRALAPAEGSAAGGNQVAILGSGFAAGDTQVHVGTSAAANVQVIGDHLLTFTAPAGNPGRVDVRVKTSRGEATLRNGYRYD
jgi:hypothetical protein